MNWVLKLLKFFYIFIIFFRRGIFFRMIVVNGFGNLFNFEGERGKLNISMGLKKEKFENVFIYKFVFNYDSDEFI